MYMYQALDSNYPIDKIIILTHRCKKLNKYTLFPNKLQLYILLEI